MKKIFLILSVIFIFLSLFFLRHYFSIFYFQNDINKIAINLEVSKNIGDIFICFDENCDNMKFDKNNYSYKLNQENPLFYNDISNIELLIEPNKNADSILNAAIFYGNKFNYFNSNDLKGKNVDFNGTNKISIDLPFSSNQKTFIQKLGIYFESLFYNWYFYLISYILVILYFIKYNDRFNFKIKYLLPAIVFVGILLRYSHIDFIPFWNDELYTYTVISDCASGFNFKNIFIDPGNPPFYFLLSNIWLKFFHNSVIQMRFLPFLIGTALILTSYYTVKNILNKNTAIITAFLCAINIFIIVESNEIRSYILSMNLALLALYAFYRYYYNQSNKNLLFYFIISVFLVNTHFYCTLLSVFNFIFGLIFIKNNRKKFISVNIISLLTFLIYFIYSYKASFDSAFNTWLSKPTIDVLYNHVVFYFGNILFFIICAGFLIYMFKKLSEVEKQVIIYIISAVSFVFISSYIFSWIFKPILFERYFCIFLPYLIIITSVFLSYDYKSKLKPLIVVAILLFSVNIPKYENFNLFSNIYFMIKYSTADSIKYNNNETDVFFILPDNIKYVNYYKNDFEKLNNIKFIISNYGIKEDIDLIGEYVKKSDKKRVIFYVPEICTNQIVKKRYNARKIVTSILPVYKIFVLK